METYPKVVTERFDNANFHINYCLKFIKKYLKGDILEVGAGCGSFTKNYLNKSINSVTLTELDKKNILDLKKKFKKNTNIKILNKTIEEVNEKFDSIIYLHVLEHIKNDEQEILNATKRLNKNGFLIIMVPAHQKIYSNLDRAVGVITTSFLSGIALYFSTERPQPLKMTVIDLVFASFYFTVGAASISVFSLNFFPDVYDQYMTFIKYALPVSVFFVYWYLRRRINSKAFHPRMTKD